MERMITLVGNRNALHLDLETLKPQALELPLELPEIDTQLDHAARVTLADSLQRWLATSEQSEEASQDAS
ncbi:hypothetical protein D3C85_1300000 [compost metagenome]